MSYTKQTFKNGILDPVTKIQQQTLSDNDLTTALSSLDAIMDVYENLSNVDNSFEPLWNEVISDMLSSLHAASSGFYRLSIVGLRSILELACNSIFYYDHRVEYYLFQEHDLKADKYVSYLVNEHLFFTTKYIEAFNKDIQQIQTDENSVSLYLKKLYAELSDIVHGRYKNLTKKEALEITYNKNFFKLFEHKFLQTLSIISVMYSLRFQKANKEIIKLANYSEVVRL